MGWGAETENQGSESLGGGRGAGRERDVGTECERGGRLGWVRAWTEVSSLGWGRGRGSKSGVGSGELAFGPAELEKPRARPVEELGTAVRRAGQPVGLKYRQLLYGWTSRRNA